MLPILAAKHEPRLNNSSLRMRSRLVSTGGELYYLPGGKIYVDGDSMTIARLNTDSLECFTYDTLYLRAFHDKNSNGIYDAGDASISGKFFYGKDSVDFDDDSYYAVVVPNYNEVNVIAKSDVSCFQLPFTAYLSSDIRDENISRDTINFPFVFQANDIDSFRVRYVTTDRARIQDTVCHRIKVRSLTCNNIPKQGFVKVKLDPKSTFVNSTPPADSVLNNCAYYHYDSLNYQKDEAIKISLQYPMDSFKVGETAKQMVCLSKSSGGAVVARDSILTRIVASYDPNEKRSLPEGIITASVDRIKYTIHFQNEGNDYARKVTVVDTIDTRANMLYFTMLGASHPYTASIKDNVVTWVFDNINLVEKSKDEELSKGYIVFEAAVDLKFSIGDSIRNKADIYFDYNSPIATEYAAIYMGKRGNTKGVANPLRLNNRIKAYPNPSQGVLHIENLGNEALHYKVMDIMGKEVQKAGSVRSKSTGSLNMGGLPSGVYFIFIEELGTSFKVIKE